tara:strand:+ start:16044 stop:17366 length:1323 start_codon:yes stop_codon:yes gene_type:complete
MKKLLIQTQLSNYDSNGKFILEADSGWQMVMGRVRVMLDLVPDLHIDIMCPLREQVITQPEQLYPDININPRVNYLRHKIIPNALATRYDFDFEALAILLNLKGHKTQNSLRYSHVYINDPMLLRNFKTLFFLEGGYQPFFAVHSHFIDNPAAPKFPLEGSLWRGQIEAADKADYNFWQCESALNIFLDSLAVEHKDKLVTQIAEKSSPWDDGYSKEEITKNVDVNELRFEIPADKTVIFVPNRVGGMGRSSDYTNCGKFLFELCNQLYEKRQDFVVIAGNPSQKFSNKELQQYCQPYLHLIDDTFTRNEYRYVARKSHIAVGLYNVDSYGGTAARECIELGCLPLWVDNYEYKLIADEVNYPYVANPDLSDVVNVLDNLIDNAQKNCYTSEDEIGTVTFNDEWGLRNAVQKRCSYERTTTAALRKMRLLSVEKSVKEDN